MFSFRVVRTSTGTVVVDTSLGGLTMADQFLQIATRLPSTHVYGFAEQVTQTALSFGGFLGLYFPCHGSRSVLRMNRCTMILGSE